MNHLLAKIKGRGERLYKIMAQKDAFFDLPDLTDTHAFTGKYILAEDEWYKIDEFSSQGYSNELIGNPFNSVNYSQLPQEKYADMAYFVAKQGTKLLFQKVTASQLLNKRWFQISGAPTLEKNKSIIVLNSHLDAIYDTVTDVLYFRDFPKLKVMFGGIDALYREATQAEITSFLGSDFFVLEGDYSADKVKPMNRKRIAQVIDAMSKLSTKKKREMISYIQSYCSGLPTECGAFKIGSEDQLKKVLYGIEERYYTTPLGKEKRVANSVQKVD